MHKVKIKISYTQAGALVSLMQEFKNDPRELTKSDQGMMWLSLIVIIEAHLYVKLQWEFKGDKSFKFNFAEAYAIKMALQSIDSEDALIESTRIDLLTRIEKQLPTRK